MKKSLVSLLAVCLLILGMLTGCSGSTEVTAESLLKEAQQNTENLKSMEATMAMEMTMEAASLGGTMDMTMELAMQIVNDPEAVYMSGTVGMLGETLEMENYTIVDGDQILTYTGMLGQWGVMSVPYDEGEISSVETAEADLLKNLDALTLESETEDVNGTEAYIISGTITGEEITDLLGSMEDTIDSLAGSGLDMENLSVDFKYAISKDEKMPMYMDMTFNGFNVTEADETVSLSNFTMRMDYTGFDTVESITVPQEVIDSAVDMTGQM